MVTEFHSNIVKGIILLGQEWKNKKKVKKIFTGEERPLSLVEYDKKYVMNYKPDVYFVMRNNKKIIFEVLKSQKKQQDKITADVCCAFLLENIESILFIHSGNEKIEKTILESLKTVAKGMINKGVPIEEIPFGKGKTKSGPVYVSEEDAKNPEEIKNVLMKKLG
jgi:hypothetical protein